MSNKKLDSKKICSERRWLLITASGEVQSIEIAVKYIKRRAQLFSDMKGERVDVFECKNPVRIQITPTVLYKNVTSPKERKKIREIADLKCQLNTMTKLFYKLQKKESFSGLHYAGEIDRLQQQLDKLGDNSKRVYPEINIEVS